MNQQNTTISQSTNQSSVADDASINWKIKYEKEHERKKNLNKKKKKAYKKIKKLTKQNQELKDKLTKLKTTSFIHDHDYF